MKDSVTLERILSGLSQLAQKGDNSVARRAASLVLAEFNRNGTRRLGKELNALLTSEHDLGTLHRANRCGGRDPLPFGDVLHEQQADDRRRAVFLDPTESILSNLIDLYEGRLNSLEVRAPNDQINGLLTDDALQILREKVPTIRAQLAFVDTPYQAAYQLRALANIIERDGYVSEARAQGAVDVYYMSERAECTTSVNSLGGRFVDNGRRYESRYQKIRTCKSTDSCCGNVTYSTEIIRDWWETTWTDGNPTQPPPSTPPNYQPSPWNDRRPLLQGNSQATLTSDWGWRNHNDGQFHQGIDVAAPVGTGVRALGAGVVFSINPNGNNANVIIRSGNTYYLYLHINPSVQQGAPVMIGDVIGQILDQGNATHVHHAEYSFPNGQWIQDGELRAPHSVDPLR